MKFDQRSGRRLHLKRPAPGFILGGRVGILDVAIDSVGVEHEFPVDLGSRTFLEFSWGNQPIRLSCIVARTGRTNGSANGYRSGLKIDVAKSHDFDEFTRRVREALERLRQAEAKLPPPI